MGGRQRDGAFSLVCTVAFALSLPQERQAAKARPTESPPAILTHLGDPGLRSLYALAFLVMGAFVTTYNYIGFRLAAPPFALSQASIGLVFVIYLVGAVAAPTFGELAVRYGRRPVRGFAIVLMPLGALATLSDNLWLTIFGVGLVTAGFFGGHSIASSWVGWRGDGAGPGERAFFHYLGSSLAGWVGGLIVARPGWAGVAAFVGALVVLALLVALRLARVPPPAHLKPK